MHDPNATTDRAASVYFVEIPGGKMVGGWGYEPPEFYIPCGVFAAHTPGQAKWMLVKQDGGLDLPDDFLAMRAHKLGVANRREQPGYLGDHSRWWGKAYDRMLGAASA